MKNDSDRLQALEKIRKNSTTPEGFDTAEIVKQAISMHRNKRKEEFRRQRLLSNIKYIPSKRTFFITRYNHFSCYRCKNEFYGEACMRLEYRAIFNSRMEMCLICAPTVESMANTIMNEYSKLYDWMEL